MSAKDEVKGINFSTPSPEAVEKAIKDHEDVPRNYVELPENMAENTELAAKFQDQSNRFYQRYLSQESRKELEVLFKDADAKYRMAKTQGAQFRDGSSQVSNTLSHCPSAQFYRSCRLIGAGWKDITFGDQQTLPARYEPMNNSKDYSGKEGERIAEGQNLYLEYVWNKGNWNKELKDSYDFLVKNGHEVFGVEWDYRTNTRTERVPGYYTKAGEPVEADPNNPPSEAYDINGNPIGELFDDEGRPLSYAFIEKTRVICNEPTVERKNLRHTFYDMDIPGDSQQQQCIVSHSQKPYSELIANAKDGLYKNVEKITNGLLHDRFVDGASRPETDLDENVGRDRDQYRNGNYDVYHVWMRAPINKENEWDNSAIPEIYEAVFVGKLNLTPSKSDGEATEGSAAVCVLLRKNPYHHGRFPIHFAHSHKDERAQVHTCFYSLLECNVEEQTVTMNQHIDNKTLGIKAPWIGERGNVLSRDLVFKNGNDVKWVKPGTGKTALTQLQVKDMTNSTLPTLEYLENQADETVGTTDAVKGQFAGSRTTGTEFLGATKQALKPMVEDVRFVADQYFHPILRDVADLSRQFADPAQVLKITNEKGEVYDVNPAELYGELKTKIVTIDKFQADLDSQQVLVNFLSAGGYDKSKEFMGESGAITFWRDFATAMELPNVDKVYPEGQRFVEAENQAWADIRAIEADPENAMNNPELLPKEGEKHEIHIGILTSWLTKRRIEAQNPSLEPEQRDIMKQQIIAAQLYVQQHEELMEQEKAQAQAAQSVQNQAGPQGQVPELEGESAGDTLSGLAGQVTA